ncbi:MAG TPA: 23S rRNA (pseudouridine(1915)-N(3))-methyltransferase RlmH [Alphaproteobacteria bacterium]|nr:23S rRNA (pseudouridine(1915)-N(3))-methyltransferase RlmH [Alphaproteobacteria bacterium]
MKILILAIGKMKGELSDALAEYKKRLKLPLEIKEFDIRESNPALLQQKESAALLKQIPDGAYVVACHGAGKALSSREFAKKLQLLRDKGTKTLVFLIGGADGHTAEILKKADFALSFGTMTWPHRLARLMLMEQLYRAETIMAGSPYHRE